MCDDHFCTLVCDVVASEVEVGDVVVPVVPFCNHCCSCISQPSLNKRQLLDGLINVKHLLPLVNSLSPNIILVQRQINDAAVELEGMEQLDSPVVRHSYLLQFEDLEPSACRIDDRSKFNDPLVSDVVLRQIDVF